MAVAGVWKVFQRMDYTIVTTLMGWALGDPSTGPLIDFRFKVWFTGEGIQKCLKTRGFWIFSSTVRPDDDSWACTAD